jgi:hypothetical protein
MDSQTYESQFSNWNAEGIFRVHYGTKKSMATLAKISAKIKLIEIVFIRFALVIENYKVNCLNFNAFSQKIFLLDRE